MASGPRLSKFCRCRNRFLVRHKVVECSTHGRDEIIICWGCQKTVEVFRQGVDLPLGLVPITIQAMA